MGPLKLAFRGLTEPNMQYLLIDLIQLTVNDICIESLNYNILEFSNVGQSQGIHKMRVRNGLSRGNHRMSC